MNVGCVPKKLMFHAAQHAEEIEDARDYGLDVKLGNKFDWRFVVYIVCHLFYSLACAMEYILDI